MRRKRRKIRVKHKCPVCGKHIFSEEGSYEYCVVCGWQDDAVQEDDPEYDGGANRMSLNEAREAYKKGIQIR